MEGRRDADDDDKRTAAASHLPDDAIFEILTRVPLQTLPSCRCACRDMRRITKEPAFTPLHIRRTNSISGCFVQTCRMIRTSINFVHSPSSPLTAPSLSLDFLPGASVRWGNVEIQAVSKHRGLVVCRVDSCGADSFRSRYYVCKPATRQWRAIPKPRTRFHTLRMEIIARPDGPLDYKIVRFSEPKKGKGLGQNQLAQAAGIGTRKHYDRTLVDSFHLEVFDSRTWGWTRSKDVDLPYCHSSWTDKPGVLVGGVLHWRTSKDTIFAFHVWSETWKLIAALPTPSIADQKNQHNCNHKWTLVGFDGKLGLLGFSGDQMEIWTLASGGHRGEEIKWVSRSVVSMEPVYREERYTRVWAPDSTSQLAVMTTSTWNDELLWYDFQNRKVVTRTELKEVGCMQIYMFESDSSPCNLDSRESLQTG